MSNARNISKAESRFVNATGDTISGGVAVTGNSSFKRSYTYAGTNYAIELPSDYGTGISSYIANISSSNRIDMSVGGYYLNSSQYQLTNGSTGVSTLAMGESGTLMYQSKTDQTADSIVDPGLRWQVDTEGRVRAPLQPCFTAKFKGFSTTNPAKIPDNGWNVVGLNVGNHFSTSTGKFTAPVDGVYIFYAGFLRASGGTVYRGWFYKNGVKATAYAGEYRTTEGFSGYNESSSHVAIIPMSAGDNVDYRISSDAPGSIYSSTSSDYNHFGGYLLG